MKDFSKVILLILSGFITFILIPIIPMADGGGSLIIVLTIPFLIALGIILSIVYYFIYIKKNKSNRNHVFILLMVFMIFLTLLLFPFQ
ncbi:hypothetical protein DMZ43_14200 [Meridianimaribacter sp. CL38]|uniref:hypothetical protein n=1 Tax=Meridianimaribacter sp. CL38 TaxID=2213021 RepID=UPI0010398492|nr:hypothetical protein [Meridianimaribacter sp. CL38]TBV25020.1 hypothetical protein DMZ43_14200 [Meridianimaribacter sp. CL38]